MPNICLCFVVHEPYRFRRYTVFDMGQNAVYEDDDRNGDILLRNARRCYLPMNDLMLKLLKSHGGKFRVAYSFSGSALDQFEQYAPEVLESFQALGKTGHVEFLCETGPHSLAFLYSREEFDRQVKEQRARIADLFGQTPVAFRHTKCIYNNDLGLALEELGFKGVLTEGAEHVLGWRSPNYLYKTMEGKGIGLLLRNSSLSRDIDLNFGNRTWSEWPLTAEKFAGWITGPGMDGDLVNLFTDYHSYGLRHRKDTGIFQFMEALPGVLMKQAGAKFLTPGEAVAKLPQVGRVDVPQFISWTDEERDLTSWLGSDMQKDAVHSLYALTSRVLALKDREPQLLHDFERLQIADHFNYMSTKWFSQPLPDRGSPFDSPYDAYITYMNILGDFELRLQAAEAAEKAGKEGKAEGKGETKAEGKGAKADDPKKVAAVAAAKAAAQTAVRAAVQSVEAATEPKAEPKATAAAPKAESKAEPKAAAAASKPEPKAVPKAEPKAAAKAAPAKGKEQSAKSGGKGKKK
ncbi:MAG: glycoside hydrolase family 57 protein [Desulfovibrio sp.]|jgi:alpha-amylase|nr:glycoside hydrolase family 57 protein [Desulfovibrio sp.]